MLKNYFSFKICRFAKKYKFFGILKNINTIQQTKINTCNTFSHLHNLRYADAIITLKRQNQNIDVIQNLTTKYREPSFELKQS